MRSIDDSRTNKILLRDGLVAGIKVDVVMIMLLDLSVAEASLKKCLTLASTINFLATFSLSFTTYQKTHADFASGSANAVDGKSKKPTNNATISRCTLLFP